ncbi:hypothetical protein BO70DRAFT_361055 [Aspergillus heteromorphus CBS 117.55]|uniref:Uncharacterized protein n=1 Tax=Aspergillus heteromorphus CBS 117.55 TaxID=1448321 RepID=A0A317WKK4_9EURO|nr:uncharacterized protein BO70DRAFT_361055 [Aspergillus heteromorphus CBS 117.55]PWY86231.1 hypothetical protein BO70DRAFT_361055 [Aspergillus heteromorphus CBS 117.55]
MPVMAWISAATGMALRAAMQDRLMYQILLDSSMMRSFATRFWPAQASLLAAGCCCGHEVRCLPDSSNAHPRNIAGRGAGRPSANLAPARLEQLVPLFQIPKGRS